MRIFEFLFIVRVLIATKGISCFDDLFAMKCCYHGEQLDADLETCVNINTTTLAHSTDFPNSSETTEDSNLAETGTTLVMNKYTKFTERNWLPEQLRSNFGKILVNGIENCLPNEKVRLKTPRDTERLTWLSNGSLILNSYTVLGKSQSHLFEPHEVCIDTFTETNSGEQQHAVLVCLCTRIHCLKKCCPVGEAFICDEWCDCQTHDSVWQPFYGDLPTSSRDFPYEIITDNYINCGKDSRLRSLYLDNYPQFLLHRFWNEISNDGNLCAELIVTQGQPTRHGMFKCSPEEPFKEADALAIWLSVPEGILLAVTLLVTLVVPRRGVTAHSYVHDLSLVWHVVALLARCLLWCVNFADWRCGYFPIAVYFFSMAASFWLNVLCLNMAFGFRKPLGLQKSHSGMSKKMFLLYSLYAWGASSAMTGFTAAMWYSREVPQGLLRPTMHETRTCYLEQDGDGKMATFAYYYGPVTALLCVNAILFLSTALRVRALRQNRAMLSDPASTCSDTSFSNMRSAMIYIKILWLMGVTEMAIECMSWIITNNDYYFDIASSCLDVIRAVSIFYLCCCKRRTLLAFLHRLRDCATRYWQRWRCKRRANAETDIKVIPMRYSKDCSNDSLTKMTMTDSALNVND